MSTCSLCLVAALALNQAGGMAYDQWRVSLQYQAGSVLSVYEHVLNCPANVTRLLILGLMLTASLQGLLAQACNVTSHSLACKRGEVARSPKVMIPGQTCRQHRRANVSIGTANPGTACGHLIGVVEQ